ncbi:MAG: glycosyltransferase family 4 protein [Bacillota bacterium]
MRYLLCTTEYPPQIGGVASYYGQLVAEWKKSAEIDIIDRSGMLARGPFPWRKAIWSLIKALSGKDYQLVLIGQILPLGTAALIARLVKTFRFAVFLHGMDLPFALKTPRKRWLSKLILKRAGFIICANSRVKEILLDFLPELQDKVVIINPGVVAQATDKAIKEELKDKYGLEGKKVLLSVGRLVERKGIDQAIKAFSQVEDASAIYLIAGDGPERRRLEELASQSAAAARILFLGAIKEEEKWPLLDLCDIFITVSREIEDDFEGFGIVYLEANLMGKPVIAGRSGGVGDAVEDEVNGLLVNPLATTEITAAISELFAQPEEAFRLGSQGKSRAENNFSWSRQVAKLQGAIEKYI